jgi:hypothetical protein
MSTTALKNSLELKKEAYTSFWEKGTPLIVNGTQTGTGFEDGYIPPPGMLYYETETYLKQLEKNRDRLHLRGDSLPMVDTDLGPGSLAVYLGSKPKREENTIWFQEVDENIRNLDISRVFKSEWWDRTLSVLQRAVNEFQGDYIVGMPDLVENWDVLASLSGASNLLILMLEQPELVAVKIEEINQAYFSVYGLQVKLPSFSVMVQQCFPN